MDRLYHLLSEIHKRPNMYLERPSLKYLHSFISGYVVCMNNIDNQSNFDFYPGFQEFIQEKYNIKISKHWTKIIEFNCFCEEEAFHRFFELLDEFLQPLK